MSLKDKFYYLAVERHPEIKKNYETYVTNHMDEHYKNRKAHWKYLGRLHMQRMFGLSFENAEVPQNTLSYPEMGKEPRLSVEEMIEELEKYDVISFDIFDTLVLRAISNPKDLFILMGTRLNVDDFKKIRVQCEIDARKKFSDQNGEITIYDIYDMVSVRCGIEKERGIQVELETELQFCFANPYMKAVVDGLVKRGKHIIATSNMYLTEDMIRKLLDSCGYECIKEIYVSCEYKQSKRKGNLQKLIWEKLGKEKNIVHVGDNYNVDFVGSRMAGWKAVYYKNVNEIGRPYRPTNMTKLGGSIYNGLVNNKFHNGTHGVDPYYELGYAYGGPMAVGFCMWLNRYVKNHNMDKIFFTSRDMYCIEKVYNKYFGEVDNSYIAISRFAAQRFAYKRWSEYYIDTHIRSRAGIEKLTIGEVFEELDIHSMYEFLGDYDLDKDELFTMEQFETLKRCMNEHKDAMLAEFKTERDAALKYYEQFIKDGQRVVIADLGWQGSNALCLKYLLEEESDMDVQMRSVLLCAVGKEFVDHSLSSGVLESYCFSPQKNVSLNRQFLQAWSIGRLICELIFSSPEQSLMKFTFDENGEVKVNRMVNENRDAEAENAVFQGVCDFADDFFKLGIAQEELQLTGYEALLPLEKLTYNKEYCEQLMSKNERNPWIGFMKNSEASGIKKA